MTRHIAALVTLSVMATSGLGVESVLAQSSTAAAQQSTERWLGLVDKGDYAASWNAAGAFFRNAITRDRWQESLRGVRPPLGAVKSRTLKSATPAKTLPGAPDGEYVVFLFDSSFERKQAAVETVTAVKEPDGTWRVVGYFIR